MIGLLKPPSQIWDAKQADLAKREPENHAKAMALPWKDISSAPKDGTYVLAYDKELVGTGWGNNKGVVIGQWTHYGYWLNDDSDNPVIFQPSHWHHIPEVPE